ncbi:cytochrome c peroxidase, mitochondrial [Kwoniella heveanensis CBS 569]|uniref:Peroxidase n=1 Tax=Kwoniella heveanensis BCC8398 TaxID=1296120 RepID=A0A1B9GQU2_9TREE|nr:cytochrome c peroxidase, mitochondrial [Kwoniella heveanensis BCC8398]OCF42037.1 cytochrome c peroxidase, mitochondrial [Kwoniella heveanensis CBS 569]
MSLRTPMLRTACARRAGQSVNLRTQVVRRRFASGGPEVNPPPPPRSSSVPYLLAGVGAAALGAAYLFYGTDGSPRDTAKELASDARGVAAAAEGKLGLRHSQKDYQKVYDRIAETLEKEGYDDGSLAPVLIRLAWHSSGTYNKEDNTGGSNYATMRFKPESEHGANNGLNIARDHMQKIKDEFPWISYGDLWTLGGVAAVQESGGPTIPWRPGRIDGFEHHVTPDGRLPDAAQAQDHLRFIFYRMGFNDQEIVALSGAHAMGRCHTDRSGFEGPWTFSPVTFSNQYFTLLEDEPWQWRKWKGPAQYEDKKTKTLMMLPTDMALVKDKSFKKYVDVYARDEDAFFKDFSKAFAKLLELGVPTSQFAGEPWSMGSN